MKINTTGSRALAVSAALLAFTNFANAQDVTGISTVDVDVELSDMDKGNALTFWPSIQGDLQASIVKAAEPVFNNDGYQVTVRLTDVSLSGSTVLTDKGEFNHMEGWVFYRKPGEPEPVYEQKIILDAATETVGGTSSYVILPDLPEFYQSLIGAFADSTVAIAEGL